MGLKFIVSEARERQSQAIQMSNEANQAVQTLQQSVRNFLSAPLSSKAYDSAKNYFMLAYTPICQSIIMTSEALAAAHKKFLSEYQAQVGSLDTDEDKLNAEINRYQELLHTIDDLMRDAKEQRPDLERRANNAYECMKKRQEKLEKFRAYSDQSASYFKDYESSQKELDKAVAEVKDCKAWDASTGTFDPKKLEADWGKDIATRWKKREKMRKEQLKKAEPTKANTLANHGLTEADLVQTNDPESVVFEKYIRLARMGVHPHTGLPITDKERTQFQYAAHTKTAFDVLGLVGGAYAGQKAAANNFYRGKGKVEPIKGTKNGKTYTLDRNNSKGNTIIKKPNGSTGTVWDDIKSTQPPRAGTTIPKSFEINVNGKKLWVNPNGTKHMIEYSTRNLSHGRKLTEQQLLRSFQGAAEKAISKGIKFDVKIVVDNWELIFSPAREAGQLPVIKHAVYLP